MRTFLTFFSIACAAMLSLAISGGNAYAKGASRPALQCSTIAAAPGLSIQSGQAITYTSSPSGGTPPYAYRWDLQGGTPFNSQSNPVTATYAASGKYTTTLSVTDSRGKQCTQTLAVAVATATTQWPSINSTSTNLAALPNSPVPAQPFISRPEYQLLGANDLGMHCGDLDHRAVSILPLFNVLHAQAIKRGTASSEPQILDDSQVTVEYSAVANSADPVGKQAPPVSVFKSNFWDIQNNAPIAGLAYGPFYPDWVDLAVALKPDLGLPVPDAAKLPNLVPAQQAMPGMGAPYSANAPQAFAGYYTDLPFFAAFPFGYTLTERHWFAAEGVPVTTFDDLGRKNPYPLMRLQAKAKSGNSLGVAADTILATVDAVVPVSGEADCKNCHTDKNIASGDDIGNGLATKKLGGNVATAAQDDASLPLAVRQEHAADVNMLRLHDINHGTALESSQPVACQTCHYTPALDLAQGGPNDGNGKSQTKHASMSRVMHEFHGRLCADGTDPAATGSACSAPLFSSMPPPDARDAAMAQAKLNETCYQCHPGKETKCLRGVMAKQAASVCQDCHGDIHQVGDDFSDKAAASLAYYSVQGKRVPWADEPGCQSCHTGDAVTNLANATGVIPQPATNQAGQNIPPIRLLQTWHVGDPQAKPIVAANRRFAEEQTADGRQVLYRLSQGHGGVFCEGCHGSTHAEWPAGAPNDPKVGVNDNLAAAQIQGHEGKIQECDACHQRDAANPRNLTVPLGLEGPHGMHPVNDNRWNHQHRNYTGSQYADCRACHGQDLKGTALSMASADRVLDLKDGTQKTFPKGHMFGCGDCHRQKQ